MKKLFILVVIMSVSGAAFALSDQMPSKSHQQITQTQQLAPSSQSSDLNAIPLGSSNGVLVSVPVTPSNSAQLIRNLPYQLNSAVAQSPDASNKSIAQSDSQSGQASNPGRSHLVVCNVGGVEQKNMTSDECKTKGGKEVVMQEPPQTVSTQEAQKR